MTNFKTLRQTLLGELAMSRKKKREEKKMPFIVATYVYASSQGQHESSTCHPFQDHCAYEDKFLENLNSLTKNIFWKFNRC
jgi:hypothetical protein